MGSSARWMTLGMRAMWSTVPRFGRGVPWGPGGAVRPHERAPGGGGYPQAVSNGSTSTGGSTTGGTPQAVSSAVCSAPQAVSARTPTRSDTRLGPVAAAAVRARTARMRRKRRFTAKGSLRSSVVGRDDNGAPARFPGPASCCEPPHAVRHWQETQAVCEEGCGVRRRGTPHEYADVPALQLSTDGRRVCAPGVGTPHGSGDIR